MKEKTKFGIGIILILFHAFGILGIDNMQHYKEMIIPALSVIIGISMIIVYIRMPIKRFIILLIGILFLIFYSCYYIYLRYQTNPGDNIFGAFFTSFGENLIGLIGLSICIKYAKYKDTKANIFHNKDEKDDQK